MNLCFLWPTRVHNPNDRSIGSSVLAHLMAESPYTYNALVFPPKLPLPMGDLDPHLIHGSPVPPESSTQMASRSVQPFLHIQPRSIPILDNGTPLPLSKFPMLPWAHLFSAQMASRSVWPFLQGLLVWQTDQQTDRQTQRLKDYTTRSVTTDCI